MIKLEEKIAKWQAEFVKLNFSNESLQEKRKKVQNIINEVTKDFEEIMNSNNISQANRSLLFTNIILNANNYQVDTRALQILLVSKGLNFLLS